MKILISGANGYIGSYLTDYLNKNYEIVHGITRNSEEINEKIKNILIYNVNILEINTLILKEKYDLFIHLAGANEINSQDDNQAIINTTLSTKVVLDFCKQNNIKKFIYFSTFQVYGRNEGYIDEDIPINCKNNYALTHFFAEQYVKMYNIYDIAYIIFRPTNVYGLSLNLNNRKTLVPTCFCFDGLKNKKISLKSSGKQFRNFISLEELSLITKYMIDNFNLKQNMIYNIASNLNLPIYKVAQIVSDSYKKLLKTEIDIYIPFDNNFDEYLPLNINLKNVPNLNSSKTKFIHEIEKIILNIQGK